MIASPRAVIFDLDGTLIDSKEVMCVAYLAAHAEIFGLEAEPPPFSDYCKYLGQGFPYIMRQLGLPLQMEPVFVRESARNIHRVSLFPGISALLDELARRGIPMAIATGKSHERAIQLLDHLQIQSYFAAVLGYDDVPHPKPAPDMVLAIVDQLSLNPERTLFVGDAIADIDCGRAAGVITALACWDQPSREALAGGSDLQLCRPVDLLTHFQECS